MKVSEIGDWLRGLANHTQPRREAEKAMQEEAVRSSAYEKEYLKMRHLFRCVDQQVRKERLYLLPKLSLNQLAMRVGTNRTYLSRAFALSGEHFRDYLFRLRMEALDGILDDPLQRQKLDKDQVDYYAAAGFTNERTLSRRLLQERGVNYHQLIRERKDNS